MRAFTLIAGYACSSSPACSQSPYFEHLGRPEAAHPHEAPLGRRLPHARHEMEDVHLGGLALELEQLVVVGQALVH